MVGRQGRAGQATALPSGPFSEDLSCPLLASPQTATARERTNFPWGSHFIHFHREQGGPANQNTATRSHFCFLTYLISNKIGFILSFLLNLGAIKARELQPQNSTPKPEDFNLVCKAPPLPVAGWLAGHPSRSGPSNLPLRLSVTHSQTALLGSSGAGTSATRARLLSSSPGGSSAASSLRLGDAGPLDSGLGPAGRRGHKEGP